MDVSKLPSTWDLIEIEESLLPYDNGKKIRQGWSPQCERFPAKTNEYWGVLKTSAIQDGAFVEEENKHLPEKLVPKEHLEVLAGDILMTCAGPRARCGVTCLVQSTRPKLLISGKMYQLRCDESLMGAKFLEGYLREWNTKKLIDKMKTGISDSGLNLTHGRFKTLRIPLPPLNEQRRIVAKIEELFSEVDAGVASLKTARAQLGVYRQSLLKQAFEGKLTEQWRLSARKRAQAGLSPVRARQAGAVLEDVIPESISKWFTYIIECEGESYYVGSTGNLRKRWLQHCEGEGADWTKANAPRYLVHFEIFDTQEEAIKREQDLKTGFGRTWRKREIKAGRIKPLIHNSNNQSAQPVRGEALQTGEQLLARIRSEREARYQQQLTDWQTAVEEWEAEGKEGKKPAKPRKLKEIENITDEELGVLPELPGEWAWTHPDLLAAHEPYALGIGPFGSNLKVSDYTTEGVPLVFIKNITRNNFSLEPRFVSQEKAAELKAHSAKPLDLLITKMGDPPGDCAIYPEHRPEAIITADCLKFRVLQGYCDRSFYCSFINSVLCRKQLGLITRGVAQKKISVERFKSTAVPLCSLPEQQEIVRILEAQFTAIEQNEAEIDTALQRAEALRQSILKKAFAGKLVPQDPNDEPASVLLERIRAEREASEAELKGHKKAVKKRARKKTAISAKTTSS